jgi:hypothetical protein
VIQIENFNWTESVKRRDKDGALRDAMIIKMFPARSDLKIDETRGEVGNAGSTEKFTEKWVSPLRRMSNF